MQTAVERPADVGRDLGGDFGARLHRPRAHPHMVPPGKDTGEARVKLIKQDTSEASSDSVKEIPGQDAEIYTN
jgi:hypothetical protein